jgi:hypothetical protein
MSPSVPEPDPFRQTDGITPPDTLSNGHSNGATPPPTTAISHRFNQVPGELKALPQWVVWKFDESSSHAKPAKVPYTPHTTQPARTTDPTTWSSFPEALAAFEEGSCDGIGFVLSKQDPYVGVQFDKCRDPTTGELDEAMGGAVRAFDSYSEVSLSGGGERVLVIVKGAKPPSSWRKGNIAIDGEQFMPLSGQRVDETPATIKDRTELLHQLQGESSTPNGTGQAPTATAEETRLLKEMNQTYAVVRVGGHTRVLITERDQQGPHYTYSSFEDFRNFHNNHNVAVHKRVVSQGKKEEVKTLHVKKGHWWLNHPQRRQYDGVVFAPGQQKPGYFNLWQGFAVEARAGECGLFLQHIRENICQGDEALFRWVLGGLADLVQNPATRTGTSVVLRGEQGTGKGMFARQVGALFGPHFIQVSHQQHLTGNFNAHLQSCLLLFVNEGYWAGDRAGEGVIKAIITEPTLMIERKGVDVVQAPNFVHVIVASNNTWVVPAGMGERRFAMLNLGEDHLQDRPYFKAIEDQMNHGGREALLHMLLHLNLAEYPDPAVIPHTEALLEQKLHSMRAEQQWWYGRLLAGAQTSDAYGWLKWVPCSDLYEDFMETTKKTGQTRRSSETEFGRAIRKLVPGLERTRKEVAREVPVSSIHARMQALLTPGPRIWRYHFPTLAECRAAFAKSLGQEVDWSEEDEQE